MERRKKITERRKKITEIRNDLLKGFLDLENFYLTTETTTYPEKRIQYLEVKMCEHILNAMKALEYHVRDDVPEMRNKKRYSPELKKAIKLIEKYGEYSDPSSSFSGIVLRLPRI